MKLRYSRCSLCIPVHSTGMSNTLFFITNKMRHARPRALSEGILAYLMVLVLRTGIVAYQHPSPCRGRMDTTVKDLKFGVIGCGGMATQVHCPNLAAIAGAATVAYCDLDESRAKALLETHGGAYSTAEPAKIFDDPDIDAVLIQTGPRAHPVLVQAAAKAGKHIFVEKPLALELEDALETVRVVVSAGVKFIFGTCNRLAPMVLRAKRMCPNPVYTFCQCSDTVTHQAVHNLDLAVNLFHEAGLARVYASGRQVWGLDPHLSADSFSATLTFADGSTHTYIQHGKAYNPMLKKYHYQLFGESECVYLAKRLKECHLMRSSDTVENSWIFSGADFDRGPNGYMGHYDELAELVGCIRDGGNGRMTVQDAAYVLAVEKAILASIEESAVIDFPEFLKANASESLLEGRSAV
jgi:predicted dehydrogenase